MLGGRRLGAHLPQGWVAAALLALLAVALPAVAEARPGPDLAMRSLAAWPSQASAGEPLAIRATVVNRGSRRAGASTLAFFLSPGARGAPSEVRLSERRVRKLAAGSYWRVSLSPELPSWLPPASYRLRACTDVSSAVRERRETNNCRAAPGRVLVAPLPILPGEQQLPSPAPAGGAPEGGVGGTGSDPEPLPAPDVAAPIVTLDSPLDGSLTSDSSPLVAGSAGTQDGDAATVSLLVYEGASPAGTPARNLAGPRAGDGSWSSEVSPPLADGTYTAQAEQADEAGNLGRSQATTFSIDTTPPETTIDSGPSGTVDDPTPTFTFSSEAGATFECRITGGSFESCETPHTTALLAEGAHSFEVTATDLAGNVDPTPASREFTVGEPPPDLTPPAVVVSEPVDGGSTIDNTPRIAGSAGTAAGDEPEVTVRLWEGSSATGPAEHSEEASVAGDGSWSVDVTGPLDEGVWTVRASQADAAGNTGESAAATFTVKPAVMLGAGDISTCSNSNDETTAAILDGQPEGTVVTLGDNVYENGTLAEFTSCYDPTWGRHRARTMPSPGNHEYATAGAAGYFDYFGPAAGDPAKGYYSYDLGAWHVISLNSSNNCFVVSCAADSEQVAWLRADLAASDAPCTLAYWHHPLFSSELPSTRVAPLWDALQEFGADVVLNGHAHNYERFAPQLPDGTASAAGIREFVVGTGGRSLRPPGLTPPPTSEVLDYSAFGVLKLTLHGTSYDWQFLAEPNKTFTDSGSSACH